MSPEARSPSQTPLPPLDQLLNWDESRIAGYRVEIINLACAAGLPGYEPSEIRTLIDTLAAWADLVRLATQNYALMFENNPEQYYNSEAYFRALVMATVLQRDIGVTYDADAASTAVFRSSRDGFINGLLSTPRAGTCSNIPVLYAALGRQLGYPIYLVPAKGHLFNRWQSQDNSVKINLDFSGRGLNVHPDQHYLSWPRKITQAEQHRKYYLMNLSPYGELAVFLCTRGHCLYDSGNIRDALFAYKHAATLSPNDPVALLSCQSAHAKLMNAWLHETRPLGKIFPFP